jgi:hypothetical protein
MRNDLCLGSAASRGSGTFFAPTSRLPTIGAALMASFVFAVALGASGSAQAACGGGGSAGTGVRPASASTGVHTTTSTAPSGGGGVHGVSGCGTSNKAITGNIASAGGLAGVDPKTHATRQHASGITASTTNTSTTRTNTTKTNTTNTNTTRTNITSNSRPTTTVHASANVHGVKLR